MLALNLMDIGTTVFILNAGGSEVNPIASLTGVWGLFVMKMLLWIIVGAIIYLLARQNTDKIKIVVYASWAINLWLLVVVAQNLYQIVLYA